MADGFGARRSFSLISPPRSGQVVLQGWGFTYTPKDGFRGEDSFDVEVSRKIRKIRGTSTIHVSVSVVGAELIR
jgi:Bacterial Ig domain